MKLFVSKKIINDFFVQTKHAMCLFILINKSFLFYKKTTLCDRKIELC